MHRLLLVVILLTLTSCAITDNVQDGYHPGDITTGVIENHATYCKPIYIPIRFVGRWMLRLIAYPVPNICPR